MPGGSRACTLAIAVAVLFGLGSVPANAAGPSELSAELTGLDAYVYGFPLIRFVGQAAQQTSVTVPNSLSDAPLNQLGSARQLAGVDNQVLVQPNLDTLYTMGHLDLSAGPLVLCVPAIANRRYYSFEFLDPYTNVFAYVGTSSTGDHAATFVITGPTFKGTLPRGLRRIRSPYDRAWLVGHTLVYGPGDLPAAHAVQDGYRLIPLADYRRYGLSFKPRPPRRIITRHRVVPVPTGIAFFDRLGTALAQNPPPRRDQGILRALRSVGIGPGLQPSREHLSAAVLAGLKAAASLGPSYITELRRSLAEQSVVKHDGWFVPPPDTGEYGVDYLWRAVVAQFQLAANRPSEAMYVVGAIDQTAALLDGSGAYVIHFAKGKLPPARYFWSLTLYNQRFFLVSNPLNRYELASYTSGLQYNPDGSLDIYVQHNPPAGHESNWLPAPAAGELFVTLRLYGPEPSALGGGYLYPRIMRTG